MKHFLILALLYISLFIQSSMSHHIQIGSFVPDIYSLVVIYLALLLPWKSGLFWGWTFGWMRDAVACFPLGTYGIAYVAIILAIHWTRTVIEIEGKALYVCLGCLAINGALQIFQGGRENFFFLWKELLLLSIYTSLLALPLFFLLSPLQKISWKKETLERDDISNRLLFHWVIRGEKQECFSPKN